MRKLRFLAVLLASSLVAGCKYVTTAEFSEYKASVKTSGEAVDKWMAGTYPWIKWLSENATKICPTCDPPAQPPPPPPDGQWGT